MNTVRVAAEKIDDKVELFVDAFSLEDEHAPFLKACRIKFKEGKLFDVDTVGSGLLTMSVNEARELRDNLTIILGD